MRLVKHSVVLLLPLLISGAFPARAQAPPVDPQPRFFGVFSTTLGGWSEYAVTETESGKKSTMRNAIVGKEGDAFWYEVVITEGGARNIIKMFLKGDPNNPENIQRLIMKNGDQPAQEMPREFVVMGRRMATHMFEARSGSALADQPNIKTEEVGTEQVTVPAGSYSVTRNRILDATGKVLATYDFNKDVLPFGVVRSADRQGEDGAARLRQGRGLVDHRAAGDDEDAAGDARRQPARHPPRHGGAQTYPAPGERRVWISGPGNGRLRLAGSRLRRLRQVDVSRTACGGCYGIRRRSPGCRLSPEPIPFSRRSSSTGVSNLREICQRLSPWRTS